MTIVSNIITYMENVCNYGNYMHHTMHAVDTKSLWHITLSHYDKIKH